MDNRLKIKNLVTLIELGSLLIAGASVSVASEYKLNTSYEAYTSFSYTNDVDSGDSNYQISNK